MQIAPMPVLREHHTRMDRKILKERVPLVREGKVLTDDEGNRLYWESRRFVLISAGGVEGPPMERPTFRRVLTAMMVADMEEYKEQAAKTEKVSRPVIPGAMDLTGVNEVV